MESNGMSWGMSGTKENWSICIDSKGNIEIFGKPPKEHLEIARKESALIKESWN